MLGLLFFLLSSNTIRPLAWSHRGSDSLYAHNFRLYFTPLPGVLLTFPSRYLYTIDRKTYLALEGGPSGFNQGCTCPGLLDKKWNKSHLAIYKVSDTWHTRLSLSMASLSRLFCSPRKFLTLRQMMVALATVHSFGLIHSCALDNCLSQPLTNIRLPTYPSKLTDGSQ